MTEVKQLLIIQVVIGVLLTAQFLILSTILPPLIFFGILSGIFTITLLLYGYIRLKELEQTQPNPIKPNTPFLHNNPSHPQTHSHPEQHKPHTNKTPP